MSLAYISVRLVAFITFRSIWCFITLRAEALRSGFLDFTKMADPRWLPFANYDEITAQNDVITSESFNNRGVSPPSEE